MPIARLCRSSIRFVSTGILLTALCWISTNTFATERARLILGVHPYLQHSEVIHRFTPLAKYLSQQLGMPVDVRVGQSYQAHLDTIGRDQIDIAYLGPVVYVKTLKQFGPKPLLARLEANGKPTFRGHIVVPKSSPITRLEDLKGGVFAFGDPDSTMSTVVPKAMLKQAGITLDDLADYGNYKGHRNVALTVLAGDADAGAIKEEVYFEFKNKGLRSLQATPAVSEHVFVTRSNLEPDVVVTIRSLLKNIRSTHLVNSLLKPIKKSATGLVPVKDGDYDDLRSLLDSNGQ